MVLTSAKKPINTSYHVISLFFHLILIFSLHCQLFLLISGYYTRCNIKITYQCKIIIVPEEGWFGQPKYSTPTKKILLRCVDFCFYFLDITAFCMLNKVLSAFVLPRSSITFSLVSDEYPPKTSRMMLYCLMV